MKYLITGDTHGRVVERINLIDKEIYKPEDTSLIILGDASINFYLNNTDEKNKKNIQNTGYRIYCVRGNHEERPENISTMVEVYDAEIQGTVYIEPEFPNIIYLIDGCIYKFGTHTSLVIGGAYSVDKYIRLSKYHNYESKWCGWFKDEQLTQEEMDRILNQHSDCPVDFIFSHTCPTSWEPRDLFISGINQSSIDKSMEEFFEVIKSKVKWKIWLFGHFHDDRLMRPGVEMMYQRIEDIENIWWRWMTDEELPKELRRDPNYDATE